MPRGSKELTEQRKQEIVDACAELYQTKSFKEITLRDISEKTSFTRTSIYNYFHAKEEIFLALLQREYACWALELDEARETAIEMSVDGFAEMLAKSAVSHPVMLKLLAMNSYDMERESRLECLVEFKRAYYAPLTAVERCLEKYFPQLDEAGRKRFVYAFFPLLFGVHPYTCVTDKQRTAMEEADVDFSYQSAEQMLRAAATCLLNGCLYR